MAQQFCKEIVWYLWIVQLSLSIVSEYLWPHGLQHARHPCHHQLPEDCSKSSQSSWWCHLTISSLVTHFSSCLQSFPASGSFPVSQFFSSGGQSIGVWASASVLRVNIQDWSPWWLTGWISLQSNRLSKVFQHHSSNASILQHSAFFIVQLSHPCMTTRKSHSFDEMDLCWQSNAF